MGGTPTELFGASIFDMDGLLVDSEPLWHEAEIDVLGGLGVPLVACRLPTDEGDVRQRGHAVLARAVPVDRTDD